MTTIVQFNIVFCSNNLKSFTVIAISDNQQNSSENFGLNKFWGIPFDFIFYRAKMI